MNVKAMLELGQECGLQTVGESYSNVMHHWDTFFTYENQAEEIKAFQAELKEAGLLKPANEGPDVYYTFGDTTIEEALESL